MDYKIYLAINILSTFSLLLNDKLRRRCCCEMFLEVHSLYTNVGQSYGSEEPEVGTSNLILSHELRSEGLIKPSSAVVSTEQGNQ